MAIPDEPRDTTFLFVGNHACLDFINTTPVVDGQLVDLLGSFPDLLASPNGFSGLGPVYSMCSPTL